MFPLHDNIPPRSTPWVTYCLIAACSAAFLVQMAAGPKGNELVERWGMVPARLLQDGTRDGELMTVEAQIVETRQGYRQVTRERPLLPAAMGDWLTLLSCMFLHGGLMHFAGNMWFLHIFGDNVEDRFGKIPYLLMYLGSGVAAGVAHLVTNAHSTIPTIGASGAIAGVMGAYILLYPKAVVQTVLPLPIIFTTFAVPAPVFLGIWFVLQIVQGYSTSDVGSGVAWWAHVGGFLAGAVAAMGLIVLHLARPPVEEHRPGMARWGFYSTR